MTTGTHAKPPLTERLRLVFRSHGWADGLLYALASAFRRATRGHVRLIKYYFVAQPVAAARVGSTPVAGKTRIYVGTALDDVIRQAPRPAQRLSDRFERRMWCVAADREGEFAGYIWLCPDLYEEDEVRCTYRWHPENAAMWDFDVFVAPAFRMTRVFSRLWEAAHEALRERQVAWTLSRIDAFNAGSLAAHQKLGAKSLAWGVFLGVGGWQLTLLSGSPFIHLSTSPARVPTLRLRLPPADETSRRP